MSFDEFEDWGSKENHKKRRLEQDSKVYFIRQGIDGPIKIGKSLNPKSRLKTLQTANPIPLSIILIIPEYFYKEELIQEKFRKYRISGEWFHPAKELLDFIEYLKSIKT